MGEHKAGPAVWYASRNSPELLTLSRPAGRRTGARPMNIEKQQGPACNWSLPFSYYHLPVCPVRCFGYFLIRHGHCPGPSFCLLFRYCGDSHRSFRVLWSMVPVRRLDTTSSLVSLAGSFQGSCQGLPIW